jgi:asparagine synthase (glutamine-hydrolysing)
MCGIWAVFGCNADISDLVKSCTRIKHRGPDAFRFENIVHFRNCYFGFHHLAIQDDVYGMQPLRVHKFPNIWLVFNGEIYNCHLVSKSWEQSAYGSPCFVLLHHHREF